MDRRGPRLSVFPASTAGAAGTEQGGARARAQLGRPGEEWAVWIPAGQEGLGLEPVLRAGGVHGLRAAVCGQGKNERRHKSHSKKLPEIELVVNGESEGMQGRQTMRGMEGEHQR